MLPTNSAQVVFHFIQELLKTPLLRTKILRQQPNCAVFRLVVKFNQKTCLPAVERALRSVSHFFFFFPYFVLSCKARLRLWLWLITALRTDLS